MKFVLLDYTHSKRTRSRKIERSLNCTEWKSAIIAANLNCGYFKGCTFYRPCIETPLFLLRKNDILTCEDINRIFTCKSIDDITAKKGREKIYQYKKNITLHNYDLYFLVLSTTLTRFPSLIVQDIDNTRTYNVYFQTVR